MIATICVAGITYCPEASMSRRGAGRSEFEAFLDKSLSSTGESVTTGRINDMLDNPNHPNRRKQQSNLWPDLETDSESIGIGLGKGKSFLKKPKAETKETTKPEAETRLSNGHDPGLSNDSLDLTSLQSHGFGGNFGGSGIPGLSLGSTTDTGAFTDKQKSVLGRPGKETMDEIQEKDKFFKELEKNQDHTVDYSRLNRELDHEETMYGTPPAKHDDNTNNMNNMLDKVALLDSMESTFGTKAADSREGREDQGMGTIPETGREDRSDTPPPPDPDLSNESGSDDVDGPQGRGIAGGTGGFTLYGGVNTQTDTERAAYMIELHKHAGMATMEGIGGSTLPSETGANTAMVIAGSGKTMESGMFGSDHPTDQHTDHGTDQHPIAPPRTPRAKDGDGSRNVNIHERTPSVHFEDDLDTGYTPHRPPRNPPDLSPIPKVRTSQSHGFDFEPSTPDLSVKVSESTPINKKGKKKKGGDKYANVKSSGYGPKTTSKTTPSKKPETPPHTGDRSQDSIPSTLHQNVSVEMLNRLMRGAEDSKALPSLQQWQDEQAFQREREVRLMKQVKQVQQLWQEEKSQHDTLRVKFEHQQKMWIGEKEQLKLDYENQIFKLKQENYVLQSKVNAEGNNIKKTLADVGGMAEEQKKIFEKEISEQEALLAACHKENEKIYAEMTRLQKANKSSEDSMFRENQRLRTELAALREQAGSKVVSSTDPGQGSGAVLGAARIAALEAEIKQKQVYEDDMMKEIKKLKQVIQEKDVQMEETQKKIQQAELQAQDKHSHHANQAMHKREELEKQIEQLQKKVRWYAENQQLLDKDQHSLKTKDVQISQLKEKIQQLQTESGSKAAESRQRTKDRAADARRIQDLERQVREMESIVRKRHPNSLPVLMWAAANTQGHTQGDSQASKPPRSVEFLEARVRKLEAELEEKEGDDRALRTLEQKYNAIKVQYEERIAVLEAQISGAGDGTRPHTHAGALQKELESVKERHRKKETEMAKEIEVLKKELERRPKARDNSTNRNNATREGEMKALHRELAACYHDKTALTTQLEQLQKELTAKNNSKEERLDPGKTYRLPGNPHKGDGEAEGKQYEPQTFSGQHIDDILTGNQQLREKVEELELGREQHRVELQRLRAEAESRERQLREAGDARVSALRAAHEKELQQIHIQHSLHNSTSQVSQLSSKVHAQEGIIMRLRDQLKESEVDSDTLSQLRRRESKLEAQVTQLQQDLMQARHAHTPEMRHFEALQDKIRLMEQRHEQRERELQQVIRSNTATARADLTAEMSKWQRALDTKHMETERFRAELDGILGVLRELQKQGVVLPSSSSAPSSRR